MLKMFSSFHAINELRFNLWLNYLLVSYAFVVPINDRACSFLFTLMLILIILRGQFKTYFSSIFKNSVVIAFIAFFGIYVLSLFWSENIKEGLALVKSVKYALFLPLFLSFIDKRFSLRIISAFLGGMFLSELISYGVHFEIIPTQLIWQGIEFYRSYAIDDPSPFLHHSHYGMALALGVSILLYRVFSRSWPISYKILGTTFIITMTMNILITGGRTGYLLYGILILLSLYFVLGKKMLKPTFGVILAIGMIGIMAYKISPIFQKRMNETRLSVENLIYNPMNFHTTMGNRIGLWYYSTNVIADNAIIGVGLGDGLDETRKHIIPQDAFLRDMVHFHNQYIEVLAGAGILGLIVFLNLFVQIFRFKPEDTELHASMTLVTVAIAIALLTETFHMKFYLQLWVVFLAASMATAVRMNDNVLKSTSDMRIYFGLILLALIVGKLQ